MDDLPKFIIKETYSIGRLESPHPDDEQYSDFEEAEMAAIVASIDDGVWGVWDNKRGEVMAIAYQQIAYRP